ncbi:alpha/beta hydrolase [Paenibacillus pini]|uniref:AB hydrolase-1 domain-containing protein n=1 Tax=Paenibacillus pini JCM 16418 TaxID=1236976 RepID=W7YGP9_9BACL|nr:alpha/beta hydrolase [Paenibacillus pini]GAF10100.1 hypothetical protein JCM16418_4274 [Paenibacillus pini JCM 16418]
MWAVIIIVCVIIIALFLLGISLYFYNVGIRRSKKDFLEVDPNLIKIEHPWESAEGWLKDQPMEVVSMKSDDGLLLKAYYVPALKPSTKTVILAHGYGGAGREMAAFAKLYQDMGYNALMPDDRGHGDSEGSYIGFGWHDRLDYKQWIQYIIQKNGPEVQIVLQGVSMGGATVLMTSGESLPEQVKCVVSDCAYTSARDILTHQLKQMYKLPPFPLLSVTSLVCKIKAGYYFGEASALAQVAKTHLPILFIHGDEDTFVPYPMVHTLYGAAAGEKELLVVKGALHGNAYFTDKEAYGNKLRGFLNKYIS